jgi:hypothetical protein
MMVIGVGRLGRAPVGCHGQEGCLSDDTAPSPGDILYAATSYDDGTATIVLVGEFDMSCAAHFWAFSARRSRRVLNPSSSKPAA